MGMELKTAVVILIILFLIYYYYYEFKYGYNNTQAVQAGDQTYNVHKEHLDQKNAAMILAEVTRRNQKLFEHLRDKYGQSNIQNGPDPFKSNRIDVVGGTSMYYNLDPSENDIAATMKHIMDKEQIQERLTQLFDHYNAKKIFEISPLNSEGVTSYTEDKKILILCLRKKSANPQTGEHDLHDINTIMFVVLHELSHMMNNTWGHPVEFWTLFKFMLLNGLETGIYDPVDYSKYPINYCGLEITYNPMFDPNI